MTWTPGKTLQPSKEQQTGAETHTLLGDCLGGSPCLHYSKNHWPCGPQWINLHVLVVPRCSGTLPAAAGEHIPFKPSSLDRRPRRILIRFLLRLRSSFWSRSIPTALCTQVLRSTVVSRISPFPGTAWKQVHYLSVLHPCAHTHTHTSHKIIIVLSRKDLSP